MAPGGMKPRRPKRVLAERPTTRATRSKTSQPSNDPKDLASMDNPVLTPTLPHGVQAEENVGNFDDHAQPSVQG